MNMLKLHFWISVLCQGKLYLQLELSHCLCIRKKMEVPCDLNVLNLSALKSWLGLAVYLFTWDWPLASLILFLNE